MFLPILIHCLLHFIGTAVTGSTVHTQDHDGYLGPSRIIFDWRQKGVISPPSDQGPLGSAMIIVKREAVESMYAIQHQNLIELSTNQIIDCCSGDVPNFNCIQNKLDGLCSAADYGKLRGVCKNINCTRYGQIAGTKAVTAYDEDAMVIALQKSPLIAYLNAGLPSFEMYSGGIYFDPKCNEQGLDHVVQIVGYGIQIKGSPFWIIKNSWGTNWGDGGYMWIQRGNNTCGIASKVFYPIPK